MLYIDLVSWLFYVANFINWRDIVRHNAKLEALIQEFRTQADEMETLKGKSNEDVEKMIANVAGGTDLCCSSRFIFNPCVTCSSYTKGCLMVPR